MWAAVAPFAGAWIETRPIIIVRITSSAAVAPFAGAWIETLQGREDGIERRRRPLRGGVDRNLTIVSVQVNQKQVAPFAGAWIETSKPTTRRHATLSPPSRGRGSKHRPQWDQGATGPVAPFAGAWIETLICFWQRYTGAAVAPFAGAWIETKKAPGCGLRRAVAPFAGAWIETLICFWQRYTGAAVAPFAGAWIETKKAPGCGLRRAVAPFAGAWIETSWASVNPSFASQSPPSRGRGSKRPCRSGPSAPARRRPLRGGVDRNKGQRPGDIVPLAKSPPSRGRGSKPYDLWHKQGFLEVAPFAGAWIETTPLTKAATSSRRRPLRGGVDRNHPPDCLAITPPGRPLRGGVDRNAC